MGDIVEELAALNSKMDQILEFINMVKDVAGPMIPAATGSPRPW